MRTAVHTWRKGRALRWLGAGLLLGLLGCSALPRRDAPPTLFSGATPVGFPAEVRFLSTDRARVERTSAVELQRLRASSQDGVIRVLALSGGGVGGAFGAGALVGLSRSHERPQYDVVTGVSAGALIAPFAFLGPDWDPQLIEGFLSAHGEQMSLHGLLGLPFGASRRTAALRAFVDHFVTPDLVQAVAKAAASGRILWIATTDLDKEETVIWDMGAIAARGGEPARRLFRDVLVASASIPGVFEPVLIHVQQGGKQYDEMHIDGNASTSLFVAPVAAYFALLDPRSLANARVYLLINGQIIDAPQTTPPKLGPIVARTLSVALKHMSRAQVVAVDQFADKYRMSVRSTYLPYDYPAFSSADFRTSTMHALFDYGARCAQSGQLWTTLDQTMAVVVEAASPARETAAAKPGVQCPLRDVQFMAAEER